MFIELLKREDLEEFLKAKIFSVKDLQETSFANNGDSVYLIKTLKDYKLVRHYVSDLFWYNAEDVNFVQDLSFKWQGFMLFKLRNTQAYEEYTNYLEKYYLKEHTKTIGKKKVLDENSLTENLSKILDFEEEFLNEATSCFEKA